MPTEPELEMRTKVGPVLLLAALVLLPAGCSQTPVESSQASAARFLEDLRANRVEPAWQGTSTEFKSLMGLDSLRDLVKREPALKAPAEFVECHKTKLAGREAEDCAFRATAQIRGKPHTKTIRLLLAAEAGTWKVEKIAVE
jgi:hypothetical protein